MHDRFDRSKSELEFYKYLLKPIITRLNALEKRIHTLTVKTDEIKAGVSALSVAVDAAVARIMELIAAGSGNTEDPVAMQEILDSIKSETDELAAAAANSPPVA